MSKQNILKTRRLQFRPPEPSDAPAIQKAASRREISDTMISIPHPYPIGEAERYIYRQEKEREAGHAFTFLIEEKTEGFCGLIELRAIDHIHSQGELSFWLKVEVWGRGYMSEAVRELIRFGFEDKGLNRLYAYHMLRNPATAHVLEKNGFRQEGLLRQRVIKWGKFEDVALWAILKDDWQT
jgi:RimJ/RimL family protein N-acetyltransferase